jgi:methylmalonyl-CoA carboxyltransferase 5S subunit
VQINVHCHATTGVTLVSLMKAIEAGADVVDAAISSMSLGPGHNPTESLVAMLEGTGYTTDLDMERLLKIRDHFAGKCAPSTRSSSPPPWSTPTSSCQPDPRRHALQHGEPAAGPGRGRSHPRGHGRGPRVKADAGHPPLVTPSSQIVGTQAVFNVLMGEYKVMTGEFADLMLGYYGECSATATPRSSSWPRSRPRRSPSPVARPTCWQARVEQELSTDSLQARGLRRQR